MFLILLDHERNGLYAASFSTLAKVDVSDGFSLEESNRGGCAFETINTQELISVKTIFMNGGVV